MKGGENKEIISVQGLSKSYGELRALSNVSFSVKKGEIFAYLGPNGAGKTTTINILCGLLQRDAGQVSICGEDIAVNPVYVKKRIGVVQEESNLWPELSCRRNLEYTGELYGLPKSVRKKRADELLQVFGLAERGSDPFRALSRGMKRRLCVAAALIHSPEVLFLDEPTSGLDVPGARALRSLIKKINREGTTIFLTTHNMMEAENLSHRLLILLRGRVVDEGTVAEIRRRMGRTSTVSVSFSADVEVEDLQRACPSVKAVLSVNPDGRWSLEVNDVHAAVGELARFAEGHGVRILEIEAAAASLEDAFMAVIQQNYTVTGGG